MFGLVYGGLTGCLAACGGTTSSRSASSARTPVRSASNPGGQSTSRWAVRTGQLCQQKRAAIAALGEVHITYAGIARVGLPAVKAKLESYLGRLLGVLEKFAARQREVPLPDSLATPAAAAAELDRESQATTAKLRRQVAAAANAAELSQAFRQWLTSLQRLSARGDAIARALKLPQCRSEAQAA